MLACAYWLFRILIATLAAIGFCAAVGLHLATFFWPAEAADTGYLVGMWLAIGLFLGFLPVIFARNRPPTTDLSLFFQEQPWWLAALLLMLVGYSLFIWPRANWQEPKIEGRVERLEDGTWGLFHRKAFVRPSSWDEYQRQTVGEVHGMSRWLMCLYASAWAGIVSAMICDREESDRSEEQKLVSSLVTPQRFIPEPKPGNAATKPGAKDIMMQIKKRFLR